MAFKILDMIAEGLGLDKGYFTRVSQEHAMTINHYPPCPDPSVAMGIGGHTDPNLITFLQQDQYGLQMHKDGKWLGVDSIPNAFVINIGYQLEVIIISNLSLWFVNRTMRLNYCWFYLI